MFASLKCDELDAFIMARQDCDKPEFTAKSKIPKKGTLSEAALGERNKILAFLHQILTISTSARDFLTGKELIFILILTKDALSGVGRLLLVEVLLYEKRNILKLQRK
jgi:hypothetical protein